VIGDHRRAFLDDAIGRAPGGSAVAVGFRDEADLVKQLIALENPLITPGKIAKSEVRAHPLFARALFICGLGVGDPSS